MDIRSFINFGDSSKVGIGINAALTKGSDVLFSYCVLKKRKDAIIELAAGDGISYKELEAKLSAFLREGVRIHVNYIGSGVLSKLSASSVGDFSLEGKTLFPFLQESEMTIQRFNNEVTCYYSVVQNTKLEEFFTMSKTGIPIYSLSLGPFVLDILEEMIPTGSYSVYDFIVTKTDQDLTFQTSTIGQVLSVPAVGGLRQTNESALAYASALTAFIPQKAIKVSTVNLIETEKAKYHSWERLYQTAKVFSLISVFTLCINMIVYLTLQKRTSALEESIQSSIGINQMGGEHSSDMIDLAATYDRLGWESNILPLYYADQIFQTINEDTRLTKLQIGILDEEQSRTQHVNVFQSSKITVAGFSRTPLTFDLWVKKVEHLPWVKGISDRLYQYDDKRKNAQFTAVIEIDGKFHN